MTKLGDAIREHLERHHWTQTDLSEIMGRPLQLVNQLVNGGRGLSPHSAQDLADAFSTDPMYWVDLDIADQLAKNRPADVEGIRRRKAVVEARLTEQANPVPTQIEASRIATLAGELAQATDPAVILTLASEIRKHVARLPRHRPGRNRRAA